MIDQNIYYEIHPSKEPHIHTLVLIHGNRISRRYWGEFETELQKQTSNIRTIVLDLRGFGKSNQISAINSLEDFAHDIHKIIQQIQQQEQLTQQQILNNFTIVGWSLGGIITSLMCMLYTQWYQRMILVAPGPFTGYPIYKLDENQLITTQKCQTKEETLNQAYIKKAILGIKNQEIEFFRSLYYKVWFNSGPVPPIELLDDLIVDSLQQTNYEELVWLLHSYNLLEYNPQTNIKGPILLYHGIQDIVVNISKSEEIYQILGPEKVTFVKKDQMGHMPPIAEPKELTQSIVEFLQKHDII